MSRNRTARFGTPPHFSSRRLQGLRCSAADVPTVTPERSNPHQCHRERDHLQARPPLAQAGSFPGYRPPSRPGARHGRCQVESGRSGSVHTLSRGFGGFTRSSRHGGQVTWKAGPDPERKLAHARTRAKLPVRSPIHPGPRPFIPAEVRCHRWHLVLDCVSLPPQALEQEGVKGARAIRRRRAAATPQRPFCRWAYISTCPLPRTTA